MELPDCSILCTSSILAGNRCLYKSCRFLADKKFIHSWKLLSLIGVWAGACCVVTSVVGGTITTLSPGRPLPSRSLTASSWNSSVLKYFPSSSRVSTRSCSRVSCCRFRSTACCSSWFCCMVSIELQVQFRAISSAATSTTLFSVKKSCRIRYRVRLRVSLICSIMMFF